MSSCIHVIYEHHNSEKYLDFGKQKYTRMHMYNQNTQEFTTERKQLEGTIKQLRHWENNLSLKFNQSRTLDSGYDGSF